MCAHLQAEGNDRRVELNTVRVVYIAFSLLEERVDERMGRKNMHTET